MKRMFLSHALYLAAFLYFGLLLGAGPAVGQEQKQLRVTVIAVTDFDDARLATPALIGNIKDATQKIDDFFTNRYGVSPRVFTARDETTAQAIRKWLFYDLSRDSQKSIHLVFVLTHGTGYQYSGSTQFKNELFLATSDTNADDYFGVAIRGSELVDAFERLSRGSSVFLFLDTCGSGSIENTGIAQLLAADQVYSTRMMILAASMSDESAFRARFTRALLSIWQAPAQAPPNDCHYGELGIPNYVEATMNALDPLPANLSQNISLVFPYSSDFCIESFASQGALALLANSTDEELKLSIRLVKDQKDSAAVRVKAHSVFPRVLRRDTYVIDVEPAFQTSLRRPNSISLDLSSEFVQYQSLYPADPLESAVTKQEAAVYADEWGAPISKVQDLLTSASSDLQSALTAASASSAKADRMVASEETKVREAQDRKTAQERQVALANAQLAAKEAEIQKKPQVVGIESLSGGGRAISPSDQHELETARSATDKMKTNVAIADQQLAQEVQRLTEANTEKSSVQSQFQRITKLMTVYSALTQEIQQRKQNRAKLMSALISVFPTRDTSRGLVVSLPEGRTLQQINDLGKNLASAGSRLLVEVEVYVAGVDRRKRQAEATKVATEIQNELVRNTGLLWDWTVARGLPGLPKGYDARLKKTEEIVISGEFLDSAPLRAN